MPGILQTMRCCIPPMSLFKVSEAILSDGLKRNRNITNCKYHTKLHNLQYQTFVCAMYMQGIFNKLKQDLYQNTLFYNILV